MKRLAPIFLAVPLVLVGCSSQDTPDPVESTTTTTSTEATTSSESTTETTTEETETTEEDEPTEDIQPPINPNPVEDTPVQQEPPAENNAAPAAPAPKAVQSCGDPTLHQTGTTFYTDGSTGWTQGCADEMNAQLPYVPEEPAESNYGTRATDIPPEIYNDFEPAPYIPWEE